eukprot:9431940-Lingulodinium_polyedra.AAC.1
MVCIVSTSIEQSVSNQSKMNTPSRPMGSRTSKYRNVENRKIRVKRPHARLGIRTIQGTGRIAQPVPDQICTINAVSGCL